MTAGGTAAGTSTCTFCRLVADGTRAGGELDPAGPLVFADALVAAFLDHRPLFPGHVLVVPRAHVVTLDALPAELLVPLFGLVQRTIRALTQGLGAQGTFVAANNLVSQSVPHLHVHVVPRRRGDGLRGFFWPRRPYRDGAEEDAVRTTLRLALDPERHL